MLKVLRLGAYEYKKHIKEINFWTVLVFLYFFLNISVRPMVVAAEILRVKIPYGVSFLILTDSYIFTVVLISAILLLVPVISKDNDFGDLKVRFTKMQMGVGKIVCMFYMSLTVTAYFCIVNLILTVKKVCFVNDWGEICYTLSKTDLRENITGLLNFPYYVMNEYSLAEFVIYSIIIMFLLIFFCGIILIIFENVKNGMLGGMILLVIICYTNSLEDGFDVKMKSYNPVSWINLNNLTKGSEPYLLHVKSAVAILIIMICILIGAYFTLYRFEMKRNVLRRRQMEEAVVLKNVLKKYDEDVVADNVTMSIDKGKIHGIIGKNGMGKTVLLKLIAGLERPTGGQILINGNKKCRVGAMIERAGYVPEMTGYGYLKMLSDISRIATKEDVRETMLRVGLDYENKQKIKNYSLGMKQRLGIAQAIMEKPDIIILDEPFNGIDEAGVLGIKTLLQDLKKAGHTVIITEHCREEITGICDRIYEIVMGKVTDITDCESINN